MHFNKWPSFLIAVISFTLIFSLWPAVTHASSSDYKIEINKSTNQLYLYQGDRVKKVYRVSTGYNKQLTPEGTFPVVVKINKPGWKGIPGGYPENPLGERWIGLRINGDQGRTYGIHGTNQPGSIGKYVSNGCIRMQNKDVIELSKLIPEGTPVWIHSGKSNHVWRGNDQSGQRPVSKPATITANAVHVRTGPSLDAHIIGKFNRGTQLLITGTTDPWVQVKLADGRRNAFVHQDYVKERRSPVGNIKVNVFLANIRSQPSLSAPVLQRVPKGMTLTSIGKEGDFYKLRLKNGSIAYIHQICIGL